MRPARLATLSLLCAGLGAVTALAIARGVGWVGSSTTETVVVPPVSQPRPVSEQAILRSAGKPLPAIGAPFGNADSLATGVVSALHRSIQSLTSSFSVPDAIQTDAPINHGNSGGPLFDARGLVIGINAQIRSDSGNAEGVGFAVPINSAKRSMEQLIGHGSVSDAYIGVVTTGLTPAFPKHFHYG